MDGYTATRILRRRGYDRLDRRAHRARDGRGARPLPVGRLRRLRDQADRSRAASTRSCAGISRAEGRIGGSAPLGPLITLSRRYPEHGTGQGHRAARRGEVPARAPRRRARDVLPPELHHYLDERIRTSAWYPERDLVELIRAIARLVTGPIDQALEIMGERGARAQHVGVYGDLIRGRLGHDQPHLRALVDAARHRRDALDRRGAEQACGSSSSASTTPRARSA